MNNFVVRFWRLSLRRKRVLAEAFANTALAWIMIKFVPYSIWRRRLGQPVPLVNIPSTNSDFKPINDGKLRDIAWAHAVLTQKFGSHFTCLMLGFSARAMLRRRKYKSVLVLGVGRGDEGMKNALGAHAWVVHRDFDIAGGQTPKDYSAVAAFVDRGTPAPATVKP